MLRNKRHRHLYGSRCRNSEQHYPIATRVHRILGVALGFGTVVGCETRPADVPSCAIVADHVGDLFGGTAHDAFARETRDVFAARCTEDRWTDEARSCVVATDALTDPRGCKQHLTAAQVDALDRALAQAEDREQARTIPAVCARYEAVVAIVGRCASFPAAAREDLAQKLAAFKATWAATPDKRTLEPICASAIGAVKLAAAGCPGAAKW